MTKVQRFIELQDKANNEINQLGQATDETVNELEAVGDNLNDAEIEEVCKIYQNKFA
jgi:uncharacterized protein YukE